MRKALFVAAVSLFVAACSDAPTGPKSPLQTAPTVQLSHMGGDPATDDLCLGLSPCDAYPGYAHGNTGVPGFCLLPPMVDNHLSSPACSGPFVPGLDGIFKLAWCKVQYGPQGGLVAPTIDYCQPAADWKPLLRDPNGGEHYSSSVQWKRNEASVGDVFRLYIVRGNQHFAHRDVLIDPNQTRPADDYLHSIGFGTEPVKVRITSSFQCVYFDTQGGTENNAATCLISGASQFPFTTGELTTTFAFPNGNPAFIADFEVSECLSLGFYADEFGAVSGNALVDTPLGGCKLSLSSNELQRLTVPGQVFIDLVGNSPFPADARPNVLQYDEFGVGALPPSVDPGWFGAATTNSAMLRLLDWGLDKLASLVGPEPLYAWPSSGWDFTRLSDFQVAWMPIMEHGNSGTACASGLASCRHLGSFSGTNPVPVSVQVTGPSTTSGSPALNVPGTRLHVFPETGSVACPAVPAPGQQCYAAGANDNSTTPPSRWADHLVVITGTDGRGVIDWSLAGGDNRLHVSACGVARPGANEPNPPGEPGADGVWGSLGDCSDRRAAMTAVGAYDNGPADGHTPFEPVNTVNEVAIYGLPLTFEAKTCPVITPNGAKGSGEWACADVTAFIAPLKGPKATSPNAWLYTYNDGNALYVGLEVVNDELGNKMFINLVETFSGANLVAAAGDDLLLLDFGAPVPAQDWYYTQSCLGNNSSSLCGAPDTVVDGAGLGMQAAAQLNGAGAGRVFYEFKRPLRANAAGSPKEDLAATPVRDIGLRLQVTQGQGGGKGGFAYPDPQTSATPYHRFTLK